LALQFKNQSISYFRVEYILQYNAFDLCYS